MLGRVEQHELQRQALARLLVGTPADRDPGVSEPLGQLVAHAFELAEVEQPGLGDGWGGLRQAAHRVGGDEGVGELPLQPCDLRTQRSARRRLTGVVSVPTGDGGEPIPRAALLLPGMRRCIHS